MLTKMDITMEPIGSHEIQGNTRQARENARDEVLVVCRDTAKCLFGRLDFRQSARTQTHMALVSANMLALYQLLPHPKIPYSAQIQQKPFPSSLHAVFLTESLTSSSSSPSLASFSLSTSGSAADECASCKSSPPCIFCRACVKID